MCRHFTLNHRDILPNLFLRFQSDARIFWYPLDGALNAYPYIYGPAVLLHALQSRIGTLEFLGCQLSDSTLLLTQSGRIISQTVKWIVAGKDGWDVGWQRRSAKQASEPNESLSLSSGSLSETNGGLSVSWTLETLKTI